MGGSHVAMDLSRYKAIDPLVILQRTFFTYTVELVANVAQRLLRADRPKAYIISSINDPNNTPIFIGPNQEVVVGKGFPITSGERLAIGVGENTEVWGIAVSPINVYILDMGL